MEVTIKIKTINNKKREVTICSGGSVTRQIYTNTNAIFPLYKELIFFCRTHGGVELDVYSNSASFVSDLTYIETNEKRLATMLKDTLLDTACNIKSIKYLAD